MKDNKTKKKERKDCPGVPRHRGIKALGYRAPWTPWSRGSRSRIAQESHARAENHSEKAGFLDPGV